MDELLLKAVINALQALSSNEEGYVCDFRRIKLVVRYVKQMVQEFLTPAYPHTDLYVMAPSTLLQDNPKLQQVAILRQRKAKEFGVLIWPFRGTPDP